MVQEKIIEIIVYILSELKNNKSLEEVDYKELRKNGYTKDEIDSAVNWVYSKINVKEKPFFDEITTSRSFRFLNDAERNVITKESFGYMLQLQILSVLKEYDIEALIDKIMTSGIVKIRVADMKKIIADYLTDPVEFNSVNRMVMLNINESIN